MADGRLFTDYRPRCDVNYTMDGVTNGALDMNSYAYRQYLITNAEKMMMNQRAATYKVAVCGPCVQPYNQGTMLEEQTVVRCDAQTCKVSKHNPRGLGLGREYGTSDADEDMHKAFLQNKEAEQQRFTRQGNCCTNASDTLDYYPLNGSTISTNNARVAVPSGGTPLTGGDVSYGV
jgi:hypothetical protein